MPHALLPPLVELLAHLTRWDAIMMYPSTARLLFLHRFRQRRAHPRFRSVSLILILLFEQKKNNPHVHRVGEVVEGRETREWALLLGVSTVGFLWGAGLPGHGSRVWRSSREPN
jgi:hypothetical protein